MNDTVCEISRAVDVLKPKVRAVACKLFRAKLEKTSFSGVCDISMTSGSLVDYSMESILPRISEELIIDMAYSFTEKRGAEFGKTHEEKKRWLITQSQRAVSLSVCAAIDNIDEQMIEKKLDPAVRPAIEAAFPFIKWND